MTKSYSSPADKVARDFQQANTAVYYQFVLGEFDGPVTRVEYPVRDTWEGSRGGRRRGRLRRVGQSC